MTSSIISSTRQGLNLKMFGWLINLFRKKQPKIIKDKHGNALHICRNCALYNPQDRVCTVTMFHAGEEMELQTEPDDLCHWERVGDELGIDVLGDIQQMRVWKRGGRDYIEMPDGQVKTRSQI